ncbi:hypothetical protein GW750_04140 [bacterium]|nr:hypothetical protein [bacterium]
MTTTGIVVLIQSVSLILKYQSLLPENVTVRFCGRWFCWTEHNQYVTQFQVKLIVSICLVSHVSEATTFQVVGPDGVY